MTQAHQSLHAARQAQVVERDEQRRAHGEVLSRLSRLEDVRTIALETLSRVQGWISTATQPGSRLPVEALGLAQGVMNYTRGEIASLEQQLTTVRAEAEKLRAEVAARQSKIRALDRLVSIRQRAQRQALMQRAERELDRKAAALAPALNALRMSFDTLGETTPHTTQQQEYRSWR